MQIKQMNMTPRAAQKILNNNSHNRNIRKRKVDAYARDMKAGKWHNNGETVKIATDGTLIDGQHRLLAIVMSGVTVPMVVVSGLDMEVQSTIDTGAKRNFGDQLHLDGKKSGMLLAAIARRGVMLEQGQMYLGGEIQPTENEMREFIDKAPELLDRCVEVASTMRNDLNRVTPSVAGFAYLMFYAIEPSDAERFMSALSSGVGLDNGSPILALRRKFIRDAATGGPVNANEQLAYMIVGWNLWRENKSVTKIQGPKGGFVKGKMPVPK